MRIQRVHCHLVRVRIRARKRGAVVQAAIGHDLVKSVLPGDVAPHKAVVARRVCAQRVLRQDEAARKQREGR